MRSCPHFPAARVSHVSLEKKKAAGRVGRRRRGKKGQRRRGRQPGTAENRERATRTKVRSGERPAQRPRFGCARDRLERGPEGRDDHQVETGAVPRCLGRTQRGSSAEARRRRNAGAGQGQGARHQREDKPRSWRNDDADEKRERKREHAEAGAGDTNKTPNEPEREQVAAKPGEQPCFVGDVEGALDAEALKRDPASTTAPLTQKRRSQSRSPREAGGGDRREDRPRKRRRRERGSGGS